MELRDTPHVSLKQYKEDLDSGNYLTIDTGFLDELPDHHIMDIFRDIIERNKLLVRFDDRDRGRYDYRPKKLANNLYGSPDLGFIILKMNGMTHPGDLDLKDPIHLMNQDNVTELVACIEELRKLIR